MAKLSTVIDHKVYIWQSVVEKKTGLREFQCVVERGEILTLNCKGPRLRSAWGELVFRFFSRWALLAAFVFSGSSTLSCCSVNIRVLIESVLIVSSTSSVAFQTDSRRTTIMRVGYMPCKYSVSAFAGKRSRQDARQIERLNSLIYSLSFFLHFPVPPWQTMWASGRRSVVD